MMLSHLTASSRAASPTSRARSLTPHRPELSHQVITLPTYILIYIHVYRPEPSHQVINHLAYVNTYSCIPSR